MSSRFKTETSEMKYLSLVFGYIRRIQSTQPLLQNIPDPVILMIFQFYPKLAKFIISDTLSKQFKFTQNQHSIATTSQTFGSSLIYIDANGYNEGIHMISFRHAGTSSTQFGVINKSESTIKDVDKTSRSEWFQDNYRKFMATKSSILYNMRLYIDVPFNAHQEFRDVTRTLNNTRPLNSFESISSKRAEGIYNLQRKCVFLWIRYWCLECVKRAKETRIIELPFTRNEPFYQLYFAQIMEIFIDTKDFDDESLFRNYETMIEQVEFEEIKTLNGIKWKNEWNLEKWDHKWNQWSYWKNADVLTMVLDCDNGTLSYYADKKLRKEIEIEINKNYYYFVCSVEDEFLYKISEVATLQIVESPLFDELER